MNREVANRTAAAQLHCAAVTATTSSAYADTRGFDAFTLAVNVGELGSDASNTLQIKLQHADDTPGSAGSYSDVPTADSNQASVTIGATGENTVYLMSYRGAKRYVRVLMTEAGTISGPVGITALGSYPAQGDAPGAATIAVGAVS